MTATAAEASHLYANIDQQKLISQLQHCVLCITHSQPVQEDLCSLVSAKGNVCVNVSTSNCALAGASLLLVLHEWTRYPIPDRS